MTLGERIKNQRKKSGLSQERVAELVGVSRQSVTKWESGQSAPSTENLFKLAEIFGTTVDMLLDIQDESDAKDEEQIKKLTAQIQYLYRVESARKAEAERVRIENEKREEELQAKSGKVWLIQIVFLLLCLIAVIPLGITIYDDMDPTVISICSALIGIGLLGNMVGTFIRLYLNKRL